METKRTEWEVGTASGAPLGACYSLGFLPVTLSHPPRSWRIHQPERKAMFLLNRGIQGVSVGMYMSGVNIFICIFHRLEGPFPADLVCKAEVRLNSPFA